MTYYPDQRYAAEYTTIHREVTLPDEALGKIAVREGARVDVRDVVAQGLMPAEHIILDAMAFFGLRKVQQLEKLLLVSEGRAPRAASACSPRCAAMSSASTGGASSCAGRRRCSTWKQGCAGA